MKPCAAHGVSGQHAHDVTTRNLGVAQEERQKPDAGAVHHGAHDERELVGAEARGHLDALGPAWSGERPRRAARDRAMNDAVVAGEVSDAARLPAPCEIRQGREETRVLGAEGARDDRGIAHRPPANREVEPLGGEVDDARGEDDVEGHLRVGGDEAGEVRLEQARPDLDRRGDPNRTAEGGLRLQHRRLRLVERAEGWPRLLMKGGASLGESDATAGTVQEAGAELLLQPRHRGADRRLGDAERPGCGGEAALVGDADKQLEAAKIHRSQIMNDTFDNLHLVNDGETAHHRRMEVLVIGAAGTVGRHLTSILARRGLAVRAATRNPRGLADLGAVARVVELDFDRPPTFAAALDGVERAFLMARPGDLRPDETAAPLLAAMRRAGVRHVVHMTGMGVDRREDLPLGRLERALEGSGMAFTHLRPNYFLQNFVTAPLVDGIRERGEIALAAGDARIAFVDVRDIAAVAAEAIVTEAHRGVAYTLTGGEAVGYEDVARAIATATRRPVLYTALTEGYVRDALAAAGLSPELIERRLGFLALARTGAFATPSPDVARVLGRPPSSLAEFVRDHAAAWMGGAA